MTVTPSSGPSGTHGTLTVVVQNIGTGTPTNFRIDSWPDRPTTPGCGQTGSFTRVVSSLAPADLGTAINMMLADRVALVRMHRNALEAVQNDLCWEKESQQLIRLYHTIVRKSFGQANVIDGEYYAHSSSKQYKSAS